MILAQVIGSVSKDYTQGLFVFFEHLPLSQIFSIAALILLVTIITKCRLGIICLLYANVNIDSSRAKLIWAIILVLLSASLLYDNDVELNKQIL